MFGKLNKKYSNALLSFNFYALAILVIFLIAISGRFKSGPCTPNLDILSVIFLYLISFILLLINGVRVFYYKKPNKYSFYIHLIAFSLLTFFFFTFKK